MAEYKRVLQAHQITYDLETEVEVIALAQLGMNNKMISARTGLTESQVQYRLTKAKKAEGYGVGRTYRTDWKTGQGTVAQSVLRTWVPTLKEQAEKRLVTLFKRPSMKVSPIGQRS